jgi:hypothetical protein
METRLTDARHAAVDFYFETGVESLPEPVQPMISTQFRQRV